MRDGCANKRARVETAEMQESGLLEGPFTPHCVSRAHCVPGVTLAAGDVTADKAPPLPLAAPPAAPPQPGRQKGDR